jgi:hypothetical protein
MIIDLIPATNTKDWTQNRDLEGNDKMKCILLSRITVELSKKAFLGIIQIWQNQGFYILAFATRCREIRVKTSGNSRHLGDWIIY